jgi:hypothetical protein
MSDNLIQYNRWERFLLWSVCAVGFLVVNTAFIYGLVFRPDAIAGVLRNPVSAAFIVETFVLMGLLAYLLTRWRVNRLHWGWFIVLSLLGSMAFALPVMLLWPVKAPVSEK